MPAVPYWDDDEVGDHPAAPGTRPRPQPDLTAAGWTSDGLEVDRPHPPPPRARREPRAPALEGLTATGAAVITLLGTTVCAVLDSAISPGLGWIFFVGFVAMSAFAGLRLRGQDSWAAVAVPPLVFIAAAGLAAQVAPVTDGGWVERTSGDMAAAVLDHPFVLLIGTAVSALAALYRSMID